MVGQWEHFRLGPANSNGEGVRPSWIEGAKLFANANSANCQGAIRMRNLKLPVATAVE